MPPPAFYNVNYLTVPAALLGKCGLVPPDADKVILYCRPDVRNPWNIVRKEVIETNASGCIVGPPGTGKSLSTLCLVARVDPFRGVEKLMSGDGKPRVLGEHQRIDPNGASRRREEAVGVSGWIQSQKPGFAAEN